MNEAEYVIARSGYSTIMDAFRLGKKCLFIPTPGQTEQEYLGTYLQEKKWAISVEQKNFQLSQALQAAEKFEFKNTMIENDSLDQMVNHWVENLL